MGGPGVEVGVGGAGGRGVGCVGGVESLGVLDRAGDEVDDVGRFVVVPDAGRVEGPDLTSDADALDAGVLGPGSHSQFGGDSPSEVSHVVGIAAHGEGAELFGVHQPQPAVAVGAHGDE